MMGRTRSFTDKQLQEAWIKGGGVVKEVADIMGVTSACIYFHANRLGLEKKSGYRARTKGIQNGDRSLIAGFTHLITIRQYARMNNETPMVMRRKLINAADRLWSEGEYVDFPKPEVPSDIQVFNFMRVIDPGLLIDDCPAREDITYLLKNCKVRNDSVEDYHTRYLEHQAELDEQARQGKRRTPTKTQKVLWNGKRKDSSIGKRKRGKDKGKPGRVRAKKSGSDKPSGKKKKKFVPKRAAR